MTFALRRLQPHDDAKLRVLFEDPVTRLWNPGPDDGDVAAWRVANTDDWTDFRTWAITDHADELVGIVSVFGISEYRNDAEIGFRTMPAARGQGVARAGVELACVDLDTELGVQRIMLYHAVDNVASCRVATACDFELYSELPANHRYGDGRLHDEHLHLRDHRSDVDKRTNPGPPRP